MEIEYEPSQVLELKRCAKDPIYFIEKYVKIQHPTDGTVPLVLFDFQKHMVTAYHEQRYSIVLSARQTGKSTVAAAFLLWFATFHFDKTILIASRSNDHAMEMIMRIRFAYEHLPMWLKAGVQEDGWNKHSLGFDNGSRILSTATSGNAGRGFSISLLYLDEFAFVAPNIQDEFWTSISPTLATGGQCIMTSTPNGDVDIFAEIWRGASIPSDDPDSKLGHNGFYPIRVYWDEPPGRDEKFKESEISKIGERRWMQEYECCAAETEVSIMSPQGVTMKLTIKQLYDMLQHESDIIN